MNDKKTIEILRQILNEQDNTETTYNERTHALKLAIERIKDFPKI